MKIDSAQIVYDDGTIRWWSANGLHREDGPAVEKTNGYRAWWLFGHKYEPMEWLLKVYEMKNGQLG